MIVEITMLISLVFLVLFMLAILVTIPISYLFPSEIGFMGSEPSKYHPIPYFLGFSIFFIAIIIIGLLIK